MKKDLIFSGFMLLVVICFSTTNLAQNNSSGTGKAPGSHQFSNLIQVITSNSLITPCRYAYYYDATTSMIGRFSLSSGCSGGVLASWSPPTFASGGVQGGNGNFYILDAGPPSSLCQLDTSNGNVTILGQITGLGGASVNGIAYNAVNDSYYLCGYSGSINNLYKLDINTLTATLISSIGSPGSAMIAIAINSSGVGYGYQLMNDNKAYTFDPVSGISTLLGPIGFNAQFGQDMDIDIETGIIYLAAFNLNTNMGEWRTMDPNTGMTTLIYPLFDQISVLEFDNGYGIVPVELISFTALQSGNKILVEWQTATETNNSGFEIQRMKGPDWDLIGFVPGYGFTVEQHSYSFTDENVQPGVYQYRLKQIDFDGTFIYSNIVAIEIISPSEYQLYQNYPNPFNPSTVIGYQLPVSSFVTMKVYDALGNEVATLVSEYKIAGKYEVEFFALNGQESSIRYPASGIYFYQIKATPKSGQAGGFIQTRKMILIK